MIELKDIAKSYAGTTVLEVPHLLIPAGESFGLVGNNGAGKTTMFSLVLDLIRADRGTVRSGEAEVHRDESWKQYTSAFLDENFLIDYLTPEEYFTFTARIHGLNDADVQAFLSEMAELFAGEVMGRGKYIRDLSRGNQKKVGIAGALLSKPEVLVLDEPFANLDPSSQIRLKALLNRLNSERQLTMLISSHDLNHVTEVCDRIVVLEKGQVIKDIRTSSDTLQELEAHFAV
jgi:ABC-2 type transport system ATP-binding protein